MPRLFRRVTHILSLPQMFARFLPVSKQQVKMPFLSEEDQNSLHFSHFFLDVCCKMPLATDKTTVEISVMRRIAPATLVNFDARPVIVYLIVLDVTQIPIVPTLQMKWVAPNLTAP